jgi:hypothetical protein
VTVYHGDDVVYDLYPKADPKNGPRIRRLTSLQKGTFARREKNGTGVGRVVMPGDSADAEAIDPALGHYVKVERRGAIVTLATSAAADDIIDTAAAHGLSVGHKVEFVTLTGGAGLSLTPTYYVSAVPSSTSLRVAATKGGSNLGFTTDITAGSIRRLTTQTGFFLLGGEYNALTGDGTKPLALTGPGPLHYLSRARMSPHSYIGDDPQPEGVYPLHNQGPLSGDDHYGSEFARVIREMKSTQADDPGDHPLSPHPNDNDRLDDPLPAMTFDFDGFTDSNGNAWTGARGEFNVQVALEDGLRIAFRFMQAGLEIDMDPDTFELHAYNTGALGTDRTGSSWGSGVVRFQVPTDDTIGTSNVLTVAKRALAAFVQRSLMWAGQGNVWGIAHNASAAVRWEGGYSSDSSNEEALNTVAGQQIVERTDAGDVPRLRILHGNEPTNGRYTLGPGGHADIRDHATVHSGTGTWDWNEWEAPISAVEWRMRDDRSGEFDTYVEFGSTFQSIDQVMAFAGGAVGVHGPHIRLCPPRRNLVAGLLDASLKSSGVGDDPGPITNYKQNAVDGNTATRWSPPAAGGPTAEHYWAADLGAPDTAVAFRYFLALANHDDLASAASIYGSNDPDAWTWLPSGKLTGDPEANAWTLVGGWHGLTGEDTGIRSFSAPATHRYWLVRATAGGSASNNEFDISEFELWSMSRHGRSPYAARCDHWHAAYEIDYDNSQSGLDATNVQAAIDELADGSTIDHGALEGLADDDHPQYVQKVGGAAVSLRTVASPGAAEELDVTDYSAFELTLGEDCEVTYAGFLAGVFAAAHVGIHTNGHSWAMPTVNWVGGVAPTPSDGTDWVVIWSTDGGATLYGSPGSGSAAVATTRWEPVVFDGELVFFDGDIVMHEVPI